MANKAFVFFLRPSRRIRQCGRALGLWYARGFGQSALIVTEALLCLSAFYQIFSVWFQTFFKHLVFTLSYRIINILREHHWEYRYRVLVLLRFVVSKDILSCFLLKYAVFCLSCEVRCCAESHCEAIKTVSCCGDVKWSPTTWNYLNHSAVFVVFFLKR